MISFREFILKPSIKLRKVFDRHLYCFFRQVDVGPSQPVAAKVTVFNVAVHLNLRSVFSICDITKC